MESQMTNHQSHVPGAVFRFSFAADSPFASSLHRSLLDRGVEIFEEFPFFLVTARSKQDIDGIMDAFREGAEAVVGPIAACAADAPPYAGHSLTEAQAEIWFASQLGDEQSCAFNEGFTVTLDGPLNIQALWRAIQTVVERHQTLRGGVNSVGDGLVIHPETAVPLPVIDLRSSSPEEQECELSALREREAWKPFDLSNGPLVRAQLVCLRQKRHVLFLTTHRLASSERSCAVLLEEIGKVYSAIPLPEPSVPSEHIEDVSDTEKYWRSQFAERVEPLNLPLDHPRPAARSWRGATYVSALDAKVVGKPNCDELFAAFAMLLSKLTGRSDIVIGVPEDNLLPIRLHVPAEATFEQVLLSTSATRSEAQQHSHYSYSTLVRELAAPRSPDRLPLVEVLFQFEPEAAPLKFHGLAAHRDRNEKRFVAFDLTLRLEETPKGIDVHVDYNADLFEESTIARWIRQYELLVSTRGIPELKAPAESGLKIGFQPEEKRPLFVVPTLETFGRSSGLGWDSASNRSVHHLCWNRLVSDSATIESVATRCIAELRALQPNGPYALTGFAEGGVIAFEIARQLEAAGERIMTLALVDSVIEAQRRTPEMEMSIVPPESTDDGNIRVRFHYSNFSSFIERKRTGKLPEHAKESQATPQTLFAKALSRYVARPYSGSAILLHSTDESAQDTGIGWRELLLGGFEVHLVDGGPDTITGIVAELLTQAEKS